MSMGVTARRALALSFTFGAAVSMTTTANAQVLDTSYRVETTAHTFTTLHSASVGRHGDDVIFFCGLSGMALHAIIAPAGTLAFPTEAFNRTIYVYDESTETLYSGGISHLSDPVRRALTVTNAPYIEYGDNLYIYGGYGPYLDDSDWDTRGTVTTIDLAMVATAIKNAQPVPEAAFTVEASPEGQVAGAHIVLLDDRWILVGGSDFKGDYLQNPGYQPWQNVYSLEQHIFDPMVSVAIPVESYFDSKGQALQRRDMNITPATLPAAGGGVAPGYVIQGGVFNAVFPWDFPVTYCEGDPAPAYDEAIYQRLNQYDGPRASFYSAALDENRFALFSGISSHVHDGAGGYTFDFLVPWSDEITELRMIGGVWQTTPDANDVFADVIDNVVGAMPNPTSNVELLLNPKLPTNSSHQVMLDEMPPAEVLLGRLYGGLKAAMPAQEPPTFSSNQIMEIYVTVGVEGDVDRDGTVNSTDLATLIGFWGSGNTVCDLDCDGIVGASDLATLLGFWFN